MYKNIQEVIDKIDYYYNIGQEMMSLLRYHLSLDAEEQVELIETIAYFLSENVTGLYSSHELEIKLSEIGQSILFEPSNVHLENQYLFVMTTASNGGGSTVIVNNWIRWDKTRTYSVVFTNFNYPNNETPAFLQEAVAQSGGDIYRLTGTYLEKAKKLLDLAGKYEKIICVHHQADVVPNIAFSNSKWNVPIIMYNHANFRFSLGYEIADLVLNLNRYDTDKTTRYRGVEENRSVFLQFPNKGVIVSNKDTIIPTSVLLEAAQRKYGIDTRKKLIVTMGEQFKLSSIVNYSFISFAENLVNKMQKKAQYIIIGPNPTDDEWKGLSQRTNGLARAVGYIDRNEAVAIISMASLFIPSFPMISHGASTAEELGVPYVTLAMTERVKETNGGKTVDTVEDLLDAAIDALGNNSAFYKRKSDFVKFSEKEWSEKWNTIESVINKHEIHSISPERVVDKEEIINLQILEKCNDYVNSRNNRNYSGKLYGLLYKIGEKHRITIVPRRVSSVDAEIFKAYIPLESKCITNSKLFDYTTRWLVLETKGYHISDYLLSLGYDRISIYGMGLMGKTLLHILCESEVFIDCVIDKKIRNQAVINVFERNIKCIGLDSIPIHSNIVINTAVVDISEIRKHYSILPERVIIISLFDIIDGIKEKVGDKITEFNG